MPHVALIPLTGFRVKEQEMLQWGMTLPGLQQRAAAIAELPALALLTLAGMTPEPWTCSYHPSPRVDDQLLEEVVSLRPALVAISALTASVEEAYQLSVQLRARSVPTIIGGLHVTACPDEAARFCDAVVVGEGEAVWAQVLSDARDGRLRPRYQTAAIGRNEWVLPRTDLLADVPPRFTLQTQRGCPMACEFCGASRLLGPFREKPLDVIDRELRAICEVSPRPLIELADDNTFAGHRDPGVLLELLARSNARWFTEADWRIGEKPHLLAGLARSGCRQILTGIESLVFRYPGQGQKQAELDRIMDAIGAIQDSGVAVNGCFIVGADGETRESLERLGCFILDSPLAEVQITVQTPFPGTGLYRRLNRAGRLLPDRGWSHYTLFDVAYRPDLLTVEELEAGFHELLAHVYSAEATHKRQQLRKAIWQRGRRHR